MGKELTDNSSLKELLHLAMRFMYPEINTKKFDKTEFRRYLFGSKVNLNQLFKEANYSLISSSIFKDVTKRKKLWKVEEGV
jgi:hypothetical protein